MASNPSPTPRSIASSKSSFTNKHQELDGLLYELQEDEPDVVGRPDEMAEGEQADQSMPEPPQMHPTLMPLQEHELMQFEQEQNTTGNHATKEYDEYNIEHSSQQQSKEEQKDDSELWDSPQQFMLNELIDEEYELMNGRADEHARARRNDRDKEDDFLFQEFDI